MLKVLIDARKLGDGGIGTYIENLVDSLLLASKTRGLNLKLSLLVSENQSYLNKTYPRWESKEGQEIEFISESASKYSFAEYFLLPLKRKALISEHDVYHSPHFTLPFFINIPSLITLHDIIHINRPENILHQIFAPLLISSALKRAKKVIFVSAATKKQVFRKFKLEDSKTAVIYNALRKSFKMPETANAKALLLKKGIPKDFILFVGSDRPHKGFRLLLESLAKLKARDSKQKNISLVAVGERFSADTKKLVSELGLSRNIIFTGSCSPKELSCLYYTAKLVTVPSKEEGFGLVALEALAAQTKLLCTPIDSLKEVCEEAANYSKSQSSDYFAESLEKILSEPDGYNTKASAGLLRAKFFSLEKHGNEILKEYLSLAGKGQFIAGQNKIVKLNKIV